jgi:hypothetical protein
MDPVLALTDVIPTSSPVRAPYMTLTSVTKATQFSLRMSAPLPCGPCGPGVACAHSLSAPCFWVDRLEMVHQLSPVMTTLH